MENLKSVKSSRSHSITFAPASLQGSRAEWCRKGPASTVGGDLRSRPCSSLTTAPVAPVPVRSTRSSSPARTLERSRSRASCLNKQETFTGNIIILSTHRGLYFIKYFNRTPWWSAVLCGWQWWMWSLTGTW